MALTLKNLPSMQKDLDLIPGLGRCPGKREMAPVFLPGEFCGQRSLMDYNPWGRKELDSTENTFSF